MIKSACIIDGDELDLNARRDLHLLQHIKKLISQEKVRFNVEIDGADDPQSCHHGRISSALRFPTMKDLVTLR